MTKLTRLGQRSILLAAAAPLAIVLASTPAWAQPAKPAAAAADADAGTEVGELVVTGSLFKRTTVETPSPVTALTAVNLQEAGIVTATEAIRSISADSAGSIGTGFQSGFSAGGSAVSLRGLGVSSTLILIDGLRSANFPINDDGHNAYVDLNSIPFSMIERIEVLKDGASSTYGADAIGGVVNLIMKKKFVGLAGSIEGGQRFKGGAGHERADLTWGFGDYDKTGWNLILNAEYQVDGKLRHHDVGFPYNNRDLTSIGGKDGNSADNSLTTNTPDAKVTRVAQTNLNDPFAGGIPLLVGTTTSATVASVVPNGPTSANPAAYVSLPTTCPYGTFTATGSSVGTACKHNLEDEYLEVQPHQDRWSYSGRLSVKLTDKIEGYATGSYSRDYVNIHRIPQSIRPTAQPFGASPALSSANPGIVLPVYICAAGTNCATDPSHTLNPNNPFAAAYASDPANGAARIYYQFGDVVSGSTRKNEVFRGAAGLTGDAYGWNWKVDAVGAKDNLLITDEGYFNIAALKTAINTGSYNFVNPALNSKAVRQAVLPDVQTASTSHMYSLDASATRSLMMLPGGDLQLAIGAQIRKEALTNNNRNACLCTGNLTTSAAFGDHTVKAVYFEVEAPVLDTLVLDVSGRYDDYSEGFSHFSPKVGFKFSPIKQFALRGTYSKGFRAPTFAESGPRSGYAGFSTFNLPANYQLVHGGLISGGNTNAYLVAYQLGQGLVGNPNLKPELSDSYTLGFIAQPFSWLSATVDYYHVKKDGLIVAGPDGGAVKSAYFANANATVAQACAAVAAVGPGYSCNTVDSVDPLFPNALPRLIIFNAPFVNANSMVTEGVDLSVTGKFHLPMDTLLTSKLEVTKVLKADLKTSLGVQKYAGTLGPYELSSGNGTPDLRANIQNSFNWNKLTVSATTYYVNKIKEVASDEATLSHDCAVANLYNGSAAQNAQFCYVKRFIYTDMNASYEIKPGLTVYGNIGNIFDNKAPVAPAAYSSAPNYLITWSTPGVIGRTYKAGVRFNF